MFRSSVIDANSDLISTVSHCKCLFNPFNIISYLLNENIAKHVSMFSWVNNIDLDKVKEIN